MEISYQSHSDIFYAPLDLVANYALAYALTGDDPYAQSVSCRAIGDRRICSAAPAALAVDICKSASASQTELLLHIECRLRAKLLSALVAATSDYVPAALSGHPLTEAVDLAALSLFGLISSLHIVKPSLLIIAKPV